MPVFFRNLLKKTHRENGTTRKDIMLQWIAGHQDVEGNEVADRAAKRAALDTRATSPRLLLPKCLHGSLLAGIPTEKQRRRF